MKKIGDVCNHEYKFNSYEDDNSYYDDLTKDLGDNYNKQEIFMLIVVLHISLYNYSMKNV